MTEGRRIEVNQFLRQLVGDDSTNNNRHIVTALCSVGLLMEVGDEILIVHRKLGEHDTHITKMKKVYVWGGLTLKDEEGREVSLTYKELYESWLGDEETDVLAAVIL